MADYIKIEVNYGRTGMIWPDGDFDGNGLVDLRDYMILEVNFGIGAGGASESPVGIVVRAEESANEGLPCLPLGMIFAMAVALAGLLILLWLMISVICFRFRWALCCGAVGSRYWPTSSPCLGLR